MKRIITISREFGSGGRTIGKGVAEKLGIPCYDHEVIEQLVERSGFAADYVKSQSEYAPNGSLFVNALNAGNFHGLSNQDKLWTMQRQIIEELGEKENCVIVGRCADYALADNPDCFSVFVHANLDWRINRISQKYNKNAKEAKDMINKTDKSRSSYYNYYTNKKWGSADSYNLCLDSSKLGIDGTAKAIIEAIHIYDSLKK